MLAQWIIERKRDGNSLSAREIRFFIDGFTAGRIPDSQMAALAMAIYFRGMDFDETTVLTDAMMRSGEQLDFSGLSRPTADKHSTGGIGDKVSLILAPLAACCGLAVPMLSGRGLGITGGTLDKLEAIPGTRTRLTVDEFTSIVKQCGCCIAGQTDRLAPADRRLYALRDVTGTVPSVPLIAASILSKKLAEGTQALVLDVKWGTGAFMKTVEQARELAQTMVAVGSGMGRSVEAVLTAMNEPLGSTAGNALEVREAVQALEGHGPPDLLDVTLALGTRMLMLAGKAGSPEEARPLLLEALRSGHAAQRFRDMVTLQGGDVQTLDDPDALPTAGQMQPVEAGVSGYVQQVDAQSIGRACVLLGAGRERAGDAVDPAVGCSEIVKTGAYVEKGAPLLLLHANDRERLEAARSALDGAFRIGDRPPDTTPLIGDITVPTFERH